MKPTQVQQSSNTLGIIAFSLSLISLIVPLLLGGFVLIGVGIILGGVGLRKSPKGLAIAGITISILSLLISPTFWLYITGLSLSPQISSSRVEQSQVQPKQEQKMQISNTQDVQNKPKEETMEEVQARLDKLFTPATNITKKIFAYAIIKQADNSYDYYSASYQMGLKENIEKAFSQKGLNISDIKVNIKSINHRVVLETNALELSKDPERLKEFLDLYKGKELKKEVDNNLITNVKYPVTYAILEKYKDVITEMNEYSGFSPELVTQ